MVDKLRKAGLWLWAFKERLILLVMVGVLANQVYLLLNPAPPESPKILPAPRPELSETADPSIQPPVPPMEPGSGPTPGGYDALVARNPFHYYSGQEGGSGQGDVPADLIQLVRIQTVGDRVRVQLKTRTATKWYSAGDKFEEFELISIDPAEGSATVFVTSYGKQVVLTAQS